MNTPWMAVLTGPVHVGKTTFLLRLLQDLSARGLKMNGLLSLARFQESRRIGYDMFDLRTGRKYPLLRIHPEGDWPRIGPFGMDPAGLAKAHSALSRTQGSHVTVIDEIGPLELRGEGFWPAFRSLRQQQRPLLVVVRSRLISPFRNACGTPFHLYRWAAPALEEDLRRDLLDLMPA